MWKHGIEKNRTRMLLGNEKLNIYREQTTALAIKWLQDSCSKYLMS